MVSFRRDESGRLDFKLMRFSPVALYRRMDIIEEDTRWFEGAGYRVNSFDASTWSTEEAFHTSVAFELNFPGWYGRNLDAFNDCMRDLEIPEDSGVVLQFLHFDVFAGKMPKFAWHVLDIVAGQSRNSMLLGLRLVALVQSDDPGSRFDGLCSSNAHWNPRERLKKSRDFESAG